MIKRTPISYCVRSWVGFCYTAGIGTAWMHVNTLCHHLVL